MQIKLSKQYLTYSKCSLNSSWTTTYSQALWKNYFDRENPTPVFSNYLLSIRLVWKAFSKSLTHLVLQNAFKISIISIYTEGTEPKGLKVITPKNDFFKKVSDSVFLYDTVFMAPSSKIPFPALLVTLSIDSHPEDWHINCKTFNTATDI